MPNVVRTTLVLIVAAGFVGPVLAAGAANVQRQLAGGASATAVDCGALTTQGEMNDCFAREARRTQDLLNSLVQELGKRLKPAESRELQRVQVAWTTYRDSHCTWQAQFFEGGSMQPAEYSTCNTSLLWSRIGELKFNLCEGGGPCAASRRYDQPGTARGK